MQLVGLFNKNCFDSRDFHRKEGGMDMQVLSIVPVNPGKPLMSSNFGIISCFLFIVGPLHSFLNISLNTSQSFSIMEYKRGFLKIKSD